MSSLKIEERFLVNAPVEQVWRYLLNPEAIVVCLPGAQLLRVEDERTYHGQMKVKVGPVTVAYKGKIELTEVDEAAHRMRMTGKGSETGGTGTAKMDMDSHLVAQDGGSTEVVVQADVQLAGRIVRFGRGMIQGVAGQLFKQFAEGVRELVESEQQAEAGSAAGAAAGAAEKADRAAGEPPVGEGAAAAVGVASPAPVEPQAAPQVPATAEPAGETAGRPEGETGAEPAGDSASEHRQPAPVQATTMRAIEPREVEPLRAFPLLLKVVWSGITGFFRKLFGRKS